MLKSAQNWIERKIPESVRFWGGIIFIIILPAVVLYSFAHFEGVASILFLIVGFALLKETFRNLILESPRNALIFVLVFTVAGTLFDGAGNFIYNKPVAAMCPAETELTREVVIVEGLSHEDNDAYAQIFSCFSYRENKVVEVLSKWKILGIRFLEYLAISLFFAGIYWLSSKVGKSKKN